MTTLYRKQGRRYFPVAETEAFAGIPLGNWYVRVKPGVVRSMPVDLPNNAVIEHAVAGVEEAMVSAMLERCKPELDGRFVPAEQTLAYRRAWEAWKKEVGDTPIHFTGVSMVDVVRAGLKVLRDKIEDASES